MPSPPRSFPAPDTAAQQLRGSTLLVAGRGVGIAINFATQIITVQYLSKSDFGVLAYALSISVVLSVVAAFGTDKAISRFLPGYVEAGDAAGFWALIRLTALTVAGVGALAVGVFVAAYLTGVPLMSSDPETQLVLAIISVFAVFNAYESLSISLFAVLASPRAILVRRFLLGPGFRFVAALVVIAIGGGVREFAIGQVVGAVAGLVVVWPLFRRIIARFPELEWVGEHRSPAPTRMLYGYSATLLAGDLSYLLRTALVSVVLGLSHSSEEVARYDAVLPVARLIEVVLVTFSTLLVPSAARLFGGGDAAGLQRLFDRNAVWISVLSFPLFAVLFVGAPFLPELLFGSEYAESSIVLALLAVGFYLNASFGTSVRVLRAGGSLGSLLGADVVQIVAAAALVIVLVPLYGAVGGAVAVLVIYVVQGVLYTVIVERTTSVRAWSVALQSSVVALVLAGGAAALRAAIDGGLVTALGLAVAVSVVMLALFGRRLDVQETFPELAPVLARVPGRRNVARR